MTDRDDELARQAVLDAGLDGMDPATIPPSAWAGAGKGLATGIPAGLASAGRTAAILVGAPLAKAFDIALTEPGEAQHTDLQDALFRTIDEYGNNAVDYWTPNAGDIGQAGQVLHGLAKMVGPLAVSAGNPALLMGDAGTSTGVDLVRQGVDGNTATAVGIAQAAATGVGFKIPFLGKTLLSRMATGAAGNVAVSTATNEASHAVLDAQGYAGQAAQFEFDPTGTAIDVGMGLAFGALHHAGSPRVNSAQRDALLAANNARQYQAAAPGVPLTPAASAVHQSNLEAALRQALHGEPVRVPDAIDPAQFLLRPQARDVFEPSPTFDSAVQDVLQAEGGFANDPADRGGATNFGISSAAHPGVDVANLTREQAKDIYRREYWDAIDAEHLPEGIRSMAFDAAVNQGVGWTRQALAKAGGDPAKFMALREKRYRDIVANDPTQSKFLRGWLNRMGRFKDDNPAGQALRERLVADPEQVARDYAALKDSKSGSVLNTDVARELAPEYLADRTRSADIHEAASDVVKTIYEAKLAAPTPAGKDPVVLFTAGGTGAGKTTGVDALGERLGRPEMIYDTNMSTLESAVDKVEQALAAGRDVQVLYVYRDPVDALVNGALPRAERQAREHGTGRTVPLAEHAKTHMGARRVMDALAERYKDDPRVQIDVFDNSRGRGQGLQVPLADVPRIRENRIHEDLKAALEAEHAAGRISDATARGFGGGQAVLGAARVSDARGLRPGNRQPVPGQPEQGRGKGLDPAASPAAGAQSAAVDHRPALEAIAANPDLVVMDDAGNPRRASELLAEIEAQATDTARQADAYEAAANCFLRNAA